MTYIIERMACRMKTKSLRKLLNSYGATVTFASAISIGIILPVYNFFCTKTNRYIGIALTILLFTMLMNVIIINLNKGLIRAYNEKLAKDANELAAQLRGNKNVDTDVLKDLLTEVRNK